MHQQWLCFSSILFSLLFIDWAANEEDRKKSGQHKDSSTLPANMAEINKQNKKKEKNNKMSEWNNKITQRHPQITKPKRKKVPKQKTQITLIFFFFNKHVISFSIAKVFACFCNCFLKIILLSCIHLGANRFPSSTLL